MDNVVVTGYSQNRYMIMLLELRDEDNYVCKKIFNFTDMERIATHSIISEDNIVYLVDSHNNKINKFDFNSNKYKGTTVGRDPRHLCKNDENIYVTNFESDNISVIDIENFTLTGSIPAGIKPHDIKLCESNNYLYISCYEENHIIECDLQGSIKNYFNTEGKPMHFFVENKNIIAMTYYTNGSIYTKINFINLITGEIEDVIKIKGLASDMDYDIKNNLLYVINIDDKSLYIIDTKKRNILKRIFIGGYPEGLSFGENNIYVTNSKKNQISVIDIATFFITRNIDLEFSPACIKVVNLF
jgi:YVTN family beta-propeller protein